MNSIQLPWKHDYINTNGIRLHYVTQGSGPLMLLLHGFPEFWYSWRYQLPEFAKDYQVVALDLRGYNDSDKPTEQSAYTMPEFIKDVKGVIEGLGFNQCVLVGHDWGGAIAWHFAYTYPEMIEKLIVMNIPHPAKLAEGLRTPSQLMKSWYMFFFQMPILPEIFLQLNDYQAIASTFQNTAIDKTSFTKTDLEIYKDAAAKRGALTGAVNYYRNILPSILQTQRKWGVLDIQTLMIWGENDSALGKELTYGTEAYVRDLQIRFISYCSHWVQQEKPQLVNQYMREFLQTDNNSR